MWVRKAPGNVPHPILETRTATILAIHERPIGDGEGHAQPEPNEQNQGSEDTGCAAVRFDPFVEIGFEPKKVADGCDCQVYRGRGRGDKERVACIVERQGLAIDGQQRRKKDGVDLDEGSLDSYVDVPREPGQNSWMQREC